MDYKKLRKHFAEMATIQLFVEQDDIPVRGNAIVSGDDDRDRKVEDEIIARLDDGDVWAWASVEVRAEYCGFVGSDHLGACCYADENDFRQPGGYYDDMVYMATRDLLNTILYKAGSEDYATLRAKASKGNSAALLLAMAMEETGQVPPKHRRPARRHYIFAR